MTHISERDAKVLGALDVPDHLVGERVLVRPFERSDAPALTAAIQGSREHLVPWLPWARGYTDPREAVHFCAAAAARWLTREAFDGGIFLLQDGRLLGGIGLRPHDWRARVFEIGYWLRHEATGRGYVHEATLLFIRFAFDHLGANRVFIRCDARNERSRRVAEAAGFQFEGRLRCDALAPDGELRDTLYFSMLRDEYDASSLRGTTVSPPSPPRAPGTGETRSRLSTA